MNLFPPVFFLFFLFVRESPFFRALIFRHSGGSSRSYSLQRVRRPVQLAWRRRHASLLRCFMHAASTAIGPTWGNREIQGKLQNTTTCSYVLHAY